MKRRTLLQALPLTTLALATPFVAMAASSETTLVIFRVRPSMWAQAWERIAETVGEGLKGGSVYLLGERDSIISGFDFIEEASYALDLIPTYMDGVQGVEFVSLECHLDPAAVARVRNSYVNDYLRGLNRAATFVASDHYARHRETGAELHIPNRENRESLKTSLHP